MGSAETPANTQDESGAAKGNGQTTEPQQPGPLWSRLKRIFSASRRGGGLRKNLQDELAREGGTDETFSPEERLLLGNILRFRELRIDDVMIPRADIDAVETTIPLGRLMEVFQDSGHSRMPVYHETLDDPRGMVHIKDLMAYMAKRASNGTEADDGGKADDEDAELPQRDTLGHNSPVMNLSEVDLSLELCETGLVRDLLFVPPSMPASDLMAKMQAGRIQMALVIDEYGGTDGLVSLEDLVEEVVGDIEDEHDEDEDDMLTPVEEGTWTADPRIPLEDLGEHLGLDFTIGEEAEDVDTLGGLLFTSIGRVPVRGELIVSRDFPNFEFEVMDADPRRIKRLRIKRRRADARAQDHRRRPRKLQAEDAHKADS